MSNSLHQLYKSSLVLLTDFYQLTMAYGYWQADLHEHEAVFYHSFRKAPFTGGYAISAGLGTLIDYLALFHFSKEDIDYLAGLKDSKEQALFSKPFLDYLSQLKFSCDIDAIEEGSVVFAHEPLLRIKGPLLQCQLLESILLNIINFQTLIATSAARIVQAANDEPVFEFGLRRAQGFDGAVMASRAAYIGGCIATSNVLAGKLFDIPVRGTHAHSWVLCFESELDAFRAYAKTFPDRCIFLVDTYNTLEGVKNAIKVADELKPQGFHLAGVRLDSGDLAYLSKEARHLLDKAGYKDSLIVGSNDLNPSVIASLKGQGAKINTWGVGTHLITAYEQPALEGVYKLSAIKSSKKAEWEYKVKLSEQAVKISTPGILSVRRFYWDTECKQAMADVIYDEQQGISESCTIIDPLDSTRRCLIPRDTPYRELMQPIFRKGQLVYKRPSLKMTQEKTKSELKQFDETIRRLLNPHQYPVGLEEKLYELKLQLILKAKGFSK
ncbi:nicotinate phosphoribosyltransferase [Rickettsiella endosymbiont of Dermanyssus gallinae]|uniref:nicotinate phosphoribosyltransferase n=1 Tax=Rickettsiella endosymbiont of Dermanyssus gallinae TaxID=2856608 RepID=UPI001C53424E|nr:nicotinate phosphoribosyltransferase [Rickettsiella endosymbiont of Dermanyssus gallinae]